MASRHTKSHLALAAFAAIGSSGLATAPTLASAAGKVPGKYVAGDFHNHTTCSDGSISMQKLVNKATTRGDGTFGLDWFVQAGHGGSGNRNCTLTEDETLSTPVYPVTPQGPTTTWQNTTPPVQPKGLVSGTAPNQVMWRWQSIQEFQYPLIEYLNAFKNVCNFSSYYMKISIQFPFNLNFKPILKSYNITFVSTFNCILKIFKITIIIKAFYQFKIW